MEYDHQSTQTSVKISLAGQANILLSLADLLSKCRRQVKDNISYYSLFYAGGSTKDLPTEFDQHCVKKVLRYPSGEYHASSTQLKYLSLWLT